MSETDSTDFYGGMVACVVIVVLIAGAAIWGGFVLEHLWNWFLPPFTDIRLSLAEAVGLSTLLVVVRSAHYQKSEEGEGMKRLVFALAMSFLPITIGFFAHLAMPR